MQTDDLGGGPPNTEGTVVTTPGGDNPPSNGDPLDAISDPDQLRAEAKKFRAIGKRHEQPPTPAPATPDKQPQAPQGNFLTVDQYHAAQTTAAKELVPPEVLENWDEAIKFAPQVEKATATAKDIALAMQRGHAASQVGKTAAAPGNPAADLATTAGMRGKPGSPAAAPAAAPELPGFKKAKNPDEWYPKKS